MARIKAAIGKISLVAWFALMVGVGATLLGRHLAPLPGPDERLARSVATLAHGEWIGVHVLYASCRCSQRIARHLAEGGRPAHFDEHVLFVGHDDAIEAQLSAAGFRLHSVTSTDLDERWGIQAAPLFVVAAPDGSVRYAGGYTDRKQGPAPRDIEIATDVRAGRTVEPLPLFGCAVSQDLQANLNPLGVP